MLDKRQSFDLQKIAEQTARLARNNSRVAKLTDQLIVQVDQLTVATINSDWSSAIQISENLFRVGRLNNMNAVADQAGQVCKALKSPHNVAEIKRQVIHLIGLCGRTSEMSDK